MFGLRKLKREVSELKEQRFLLEKQLQSILEDKVNTIVKNEFARVSDSFDKLIVSESERLRKDYKNFKKVVNERLAEK